MAPLASGYECVVLYVLSVRGRCHRESLSKGYPLRGQRGRGMKPKHRGVYKVLRPLPVGRRRQKSVLDTTYLLESTVLSWTHWLRAYHSPEPKPTLHSACRWTGSRPDTAVQQRLLSGRISMPALTGSSSTLPRSS